MSTDDGVPLDAFEAAVDVLIRQRRREIRDLDADIADDADAESDIKARIAALNTRSQAAREATNDAKARLANIARYVDGLIGSWVVERGALEKDLEETERIVSRDSLCGVWTRTGIAPAKPIAAPQQEEVAASAPESKEPATAATSTADSATTGASESADPPPAAAAPADAESPATTEKPEPVAGAATETAEPAPAAATTAQPAEEEDPSDSCESLPRVEDVTSSLSALRSHHDLESARVFDAYLRFEQASRRIHAVEESFIDKILLETGKEMQRLQKIRVTLLPRLRDQIFQIKRGSFVKHMTTSKKKTDAHIEMQQAGKQLAATADAIQQIKPRVANLRLELREVQRDLENTKGATAKEKASLEAELQQTKVALEEAEWSLTSAQEESKQIREVRSSTLQVSSEVRSLKRAGAA